VLLADVLAKKQRDKGADTEEKYAPGLALYHAHFSEYRL